MRFDITDLRLFLHVAEAGSITAGADRTSLALASVSERIRGMEATAGTALLVRRQRGVALTPAGGALARHAREILAACDRMRGELADYGCGLKTVVRMMANTSALSEHLPDPLGAFLSAHPSVDVELDEGSSAEIYEAVAAGRVEIGVASDQVDHGELDVAPFRRDALALVAPRGHPLAGRRSVTFAETLEHEQVGLGSHGALQTYLAAQARRIGRTIPARVKVRGFEAVCRIVAQGAGVAIVPEAAARRARRTAEIVIAPLSDAWAARRLVLATRPGVAPSPQAAALIAALARDAS